MDFISFKFARALLWYFVFYPRMTLHPNRTTSTSSSLFILCIFYEKVLILFLLRADVFEKNLRPKAEDARQRRLPRALVIGAKKSGTGALMHFMGMFLPRDIFQSTKEN